MLVPSETIRTSNEASAVTASLTVTPVSAGQALRVSRPPEQWDTGDVHAYVAEEITRLNGPQLPAKGTLHVIDDFCRRYGIPTAVRIARAAFEVYGGRWQGAPVTWRRFAQAHDAFFAEIILAAMT
jgi:hypothetical protein